MYGSQQLTRGATFQAVDNGGDRNCHFLGFARISKFFALERDVVGTVVECCELVHMDYLCC